MVNGSLLFAVSSYQFAVDGWQNAVWSLWFGIWCLKSAACSLFLVHSPPGAGRARLWRGLWKDWISECDCGVIARPKG